VSKTKSAELVESVYAEGHRHFGENYVQEIVKKAPELPKDIQWHFIGKLQSNKCKMLLAGVPNLFMVETVDSVKLATKLDAASASNRDRPLSVCVQVNTSGEASKSGCSPSDCVGLVRHVVEKCKHLHFSGLMTIGRYGDTTSECFEILSSCKSKVLKAIDLPSSVKTNFELSMGMSGDFPLAIKSGSTSVRIGSMIFGARDYSK